jgi:hypothetical protein
MRLIRLLLLEVSRASRPNFLLCVARLYVPLVVLPYGVRHSHIPRIYVHRGTLLGSSASARYPRFDGVDNAQE